MLKLTGLSAFGGVGATGFSQQSRAQTSDEVLFEQDFSSVSAGSVPESFALAGNNSQQVTEGTAASGTKSYQMNGSYGGCWEAIARRSMTVADEMTVSGSYRLENGEVGCHDNKAGAIGLKTVASGSWSDGSGVRLLQFTPDGTVVSQGETVGSFSRQEWADFEVEYVRDREAGTVTYNCQINDGDRVSVTRDAADHEDDLSALQLTSGDFTVFWDEFQISEGVESEDDAAEYELSVQSVTPNPAAPKADVTVSVQVTNTGTTAGTHPIDLNYEGDRLARQEVALDPGAQTTVDFVIDAPTSPGEQTVTIEADENSTTTILMVEERDEPSLELAVDSVEPQPVAPGEPVAVTATVRNSGSTAVTQSVALALDSEVLARREVSLGSGAETTVDFVIDAPTSPGEQTVTIEADENSTTTILMVEERDEPSLELAVDSVEPQPAAPGEPVVVTATVRNSGSTAVTQPVALAVDSDEIDRQEITVDAGAETDISFSLEAPETAGESDLTLSSGERSTTSSLVVEAEDEPQCTGSPRMARTSITSPQGSITADRPATVEANFRVDPNVPEGCSVVVNVQYSISKSGFQFSGGSDWDQSATDIVATEFDGIRPGEIRSISADVEARGADPGDEVTVVATYELWYAGSRGDSVQQTTRETITVDSVGGGSGGDDTSDDDSVGGGSGGDGTGGDDSDDTVSVEIPGFGIPSSVAALGSAGYMLKRRLTDDEP